MQRRAGTGGDATFVQGDIVFRDKELAHVSGLAWAFVVSSAQPKVASQLVGYDMIRPLLRQIIKVVE